MTDLPDAPSHWLTTVDPSAFPPPTSLPASTEVAIVGGGIMGVSVAYWLARSGIPAVLLEARDLASGATGRNAGLMLAGSKPIENPELVRSVLDEENIDAAYSAPGHLALASSEDIWDQFCAEADKRRDTPNPVHSINHASCEGLLGMKISKRFLGGRYYPAGGMVNPTRLVYGLAAAAQRRGTAIVTQTPVSSVAPTSSQTGFTIYTNRGDLQARQVIFACSTSLTTFAPQFKDVISPVRGQVLSTQPLPTVFRLGLGVDFGTVYWRQAPDGAIVIGGYRNLDRITETSTDESLNPDIQQALADFLPNTFPNFPRISVRRRWAGIMDYPTDGQPIIGPIPDSPNQWVITGFGGHGLPGAIGAAKALTEAITTGNTPAILDPYSPARFTG
ncbi:MAG: FAD-binding oxidoreductase [Chloroflexia bacterium]